MVLRDSLANKNPSQTLRVFLTEPTEHPTQVLGLWHVVPIVHDVLHFTEGQ